MNLTVSQYINVGNYPDREFYQNQRMRQVCKQLVIDLPNYLVKTMEVEMQRIQEQGVEDFKDGRRLIEILSEGGGIYSYNLEIKVWQPTEVRTTNN